MIKRATSIKTALVWRVVAIILLVWALTAVFSYRGTRAEIFQKFDDDLAMDARILLAQVVHEIYEVGVENVREEFGSILQDQEGVEFGRGTEFLIYGKSGELLMSTSHAPDLSAIALSQGFSDQQTGGAYWRVYTHFNRWSGISVRGAELRDKRERMMEYVLAQTLYPVAFAVPIISMLLWMGVGGGLRSLRELVSAVSKRHGDNLRPIDLEEVPEEVVPLVTELNRLMQRLESALESERRLTANAAHELKTPLAALKINTQVALRSEPGPDQDRALRNIQSSIDRISRLIEQILVLGRVEQAQRPLASRFDLSRQLKASVVDLQPLAEQKQVRFRIDCPDECAGKSLRGHAKEIDLLFFNLFENAVKYSPPGGEVTVTVGRRDDHVEMVVCDQGPGVPPEELPKIERRFYRGRGCLQEGSGLGLAIAREIADRNGIAMSFGNVEPHGFLARLRFSSDGSGGDDLVSFP